MTQDQLQSIELEQSVLSETLLTKAARLKVVTELHKDDFSRPEHKTLFKTIQDLTLRDKAVDLPLLVEALKAQTDRYTKQTYLDAIGGLPFLTQIAMTAPTAANVASHIAKLKALSNRRKMLDKLSELQKKAADLSVDDDKITSCYQGLCSLMGQPVEIKIDHMQTAKEVAMDAYAEISEQYSNPESEKNGIKTGLTDLDARIGSLKPKDLYIIAGRTGQGKSALALTIAVNAANAGKNVLYCGLEMSNTETFKRALARAACVNGQKLFNPSLLAEKDWNSIVKGNELLSRLPIVFDDSSTLSPLDVKQKASIDFKQKTGKTPDLIIVDYIGLMSAGMRKENRVQEVSYISRALKQVASDLNCPLIALSQLSRDVDKEKRAPRLSDLKESGSIEQDASGVILIQRDTGLSGDNKAVTYRMTSMLYVPKWRNAPIDKPIKVIFDAEHLTFQDYTSRKEGE